MKASAKLKQLEEENEDAMFVIVSDVWLDNIEVMEKLSLMFSGGVLVSSLDFAQVVCTPATRELLSCRLRLDASHVFHLLWQLFICPVWKRAD